MDAGLLLGGLLFAAIGALLFVQGERLTAQSFNWYRRIFGRVLDDRWVWRLMSARRERINVWETRASGVVVMLVGVVLIITAAAH